MNGSDYSRVAKAIRYIEANLEHQPALAEVAAHLGMSEYHFHRLFRRWAGVTPKDFLQALTLARAKKLLVESRSLLEASADLGLSGTSRLHDLFVSYEAMTPGDYKSGGADLAISFAVKPTPFGDALFAATDRGLCGVHFLEDSSERAAIEHLRSRWPRARLRRDIPRILPFAREVNQRMRGTFGEPLALVLKGSAFQLKVWEALMRVPEGHALSYQTLAASIGAGSASRAVGSAVGANPIAYLIPCHRIIRASGDIGEYRWGAERKTALLGVECARRLSS